MKTPDNNPFERNYIPSGYAINKLNELAGYLSQEDKNKFLRSLDAILEVANKAYPESSVVGLVGLSLFTHEHVSNLGLKTPSPAFDHEYMKFLMSYLQLSKIGKQEVSTKIATLIDPDISSIPDTIGEDFRP